MLRLKSSESRIDKIFLSILIGILLFGIFMVFNSSYVVASQVFKDKFHFLKLQSFWAFLGLISMIFSSKINYHFWKKVSFPVYLLSLILLFLVLIPKIGLEIQGGRRWLGIGEFTFQPSEIAKISLILYLASLMEKRKDFKKFIFISFLTAILVILEPNLSTALILLTSSFIVYFLSGANFWELFLILVSVVLLVIGLIILAPYRLSRLKVFLNPQFDPEGASYHLRQILIALGSGGIFGRGLGQSRQKFLFLPETFSDSIFAIIGEELGFLGSLIFLGFYWLLIVRGLKISMAAPDKFGQMIGAGLVSLVFVQSFLNLGSMLSLIPLTGVPLPFISYGGSSLVVLLFGMGILLNISKFRTELKK